jgi:hypothetical protein
MSIKYFVLRERGETEKTKLHNHELNIPSISINSNNFLRYVTAIPASHNMTLPSVNAQLLNKLV